MTGSRVSELPSASSHPPCLLVLMPVMDLSTHVDLFILSSSLQKRALLVFPVRHGGFE